MAVAADVATWLAFLRGINLGPSHKVPMAELRSLLSEELGYTDVKTMLNSGNVVFTATGGAAASHEKAIARAIEARFGFPVPTIVRSVASVRKVLDANPFAGAPEKQLHVVFVSKKPPMPAPADIAPDEAAYGDKVVYLRLPNGVAGGKVGDLGKGGARSGVVATARTVQTVTKLVALAAP